MLCRLIPIPGDLFKVQVGIIADSERADFGSEFAQASLCQLAVLGLQGATKLLARSFDR